MLMMKGKLQRVVVLLEITLSWMTVEREERARFFGVLRSPALIKSSLSDTTLLVDGGASR
jgi:hypothetical protein